MHVVYLSRNFGHQPAVTAGLTASLGQAVVIIDADLQDPPELIPEMVALWRSGYKVVYGIRQQREGETTQHAGRPAPRPGMQAEQDLQSSGRRRSVSWHAGAP